MVVVVGTGLAGDLDHRLGPIMEAHINAVQLPFQLGQFRCEQRITRHHRGINIVFERRHGHHQRIVQLATDAGQLLVHRLGLLYRGAFLGASTCCQQDNHGHQSPQLG